MTKFEWILFDADDTLLDFDNAGRLAFSSMLATYGIPEIPTHYQLYKSCNQRTWQAYENGEIDAITLRRKRFADFKEQAGLPAWMDPVAMNASYLENLIQHTEPLDGALDLLETLKSLRVRMGIITNGLREVQRPRIRQAGMENFFQVVLVSDEIGLAKPDTRFFARAHTEMGLPEKEKVLVVGDSYSSDITGAKNFAFPSCWFNPKALQPPADAQPDFDIRSLKEVLKIVS